MTKKQQKNIEISQRMYKKWTNKVFGQKIWENINQKINEKLAEPFRNSEKVLKILHKKKDWIKYT